MRILPFGGGPKQGTYASSDHDFQAMIEALPVAVMTCELKGFTIDYANAKSVELLKGLQEHLKLDPEKIVGTCVDTFHKNPSHQRTLLSNPNNLPHKAIIQLGDEYLDLHISAQYDKAGNYRKAILSWSVVTEKVNADRESARLLQMLDKMPINVMTCELENFSINYVNQTSKDTLAKVQEYLPVRAEDLLGTSIDVFHKNPEHQRRLLRDKNNLPHKANIKVGPETLALSVSAIEGANGEYLGPMLTWAIVTDNIRMGEQVMNVVEGLTKSSEEMSASATQMQNLAGETTQLSASVSAASEEMTASIKEISQQLAHATDITNNAVREAEEADNYVNTLSASAEQINQITEVIESLADSTNLLSLNATIEAARAGEAGKGFAVVASEVKALARRTAEATTQIRDQVEDIQGVIGTTVTAIQNIGKTIGDINKVAAQISAAVEEQTATTAEVSTSINGVSNASNQTGGAAEGVRTVADQVKELSANLSAEIEQFMQNTTNG